MPGHSGHRQRVKTEFLARGVEGWSDHRILELLLFYAIPQGDVNELAHRLVDHFGSLAGVLDALPHPRAEEILQEIILRQKTRNAQEMAREILTQVLLYQKCLAKDDMTVLVGGLWKS